MTKSKTRYIRLIDRPHNHVGTAIMSDITGGVEVGINLKTRKTAQFEKTKSAI